MDKKSVWISNIIFALSGFVLGGLLVWGLIHFYDTGEEKKITNTNNGEVSSNKDEQVSVSLTEKEATNLLEKYAFGYCENADSIISKMYSGSFKVSDLSKSEMLTLALKNIKDIPVCSATDTKVVTLDEIKKSLINLFNSDMNYTETDLKNASSLLGTYVISQTNKGIDVVDSNCDGCGIGPNNFIARKYEKYDTDADKLYIYEKFAFAKVSVEANNDEEYNYNYYTSFDSKKVVETLSSTTPNWEKYNTYRYQFKIVDNNYYLEGIELVK